MGSTAVIPRVAVRNDVSLFQGPERCGFAISLLPPVAFASARDRADRFDDPLCCNREGGAA